MNKGRETEQKPTDKIPPDVNPTKARATRVSDGQSVNKSGHRRQAHSQILTAKKICCPKSLTSWKEKMAQWFAKTKQHKTEQKTNSEFWLEEKFKRQ